MVAKRDALTGLGNRLAYDEYMARSGGASGRSILTIVNIDLDDFKQINDRFGHEAGDKVLRFFARQLEDVFGGPGWRFVWGEMSLSYCSAKNAGKEYRRILKSFRNEFAIIMKPVNDRIICRLVAGLRFLMIHIRAFMNFYIGRMR